MNGLSSISPQPLPPGLSPIPSLPPLPTISDFLPKSSPGSSTEPEGEPSPQSNGLFTALIRDPVVLYQEYLSHPDLIDEDVGLLLTQLVTRQKRLEDLTPEEMQKLDRATVDFAQGPPKPKPSLPRATSTPRTSTVHEEPDVEWHEGGMRLPEPVAPIDIPTVPTRWWDKSNH